MRIQEPSRSSRCRQRLATPPLHICSRSLGEICLAIWNLYILQTQCSNQSHISVYFCAFMFVRLSPPESPLSLSTQVHRGVVVTALICESEYAVHACRRHIPHGARAGRDDDGSNLGMSFPGMVHCHTAN